MGVFLNNITSMKFTWKHSIWRGRNVWLILINKKTTTGYFIICMVPFFLNVKRFQSTFLMISSSLYDINVTKVAPLYRIMNQRGCFWLNDDFLCIVVFILVITSWWFDAVIRPFLVSTHNWLLLCSHVFILTVITW